MCPKDLKLLRWLPQNDEYIEIVNKKIPDKEHIIRRCSFEPHSKLSNLSLTPYNLILFGKEVGLHDSSLLQIILTYLKDHKQAIDPKKTSLPALIEILRNRVVVSNSIEWLSKIVSKDTQQQLSKIDVLR